MMVSFTALLTKTIKLVFTVSLLSFNIKNKIKDCYGNSQDIVPDWSHMSTCAAVVMVTVRILYLIGVTCLLVLQLLW
jgi:hypothetical protein